IGVGFGLHAFEADPYTGVAARDVDAGVEVAQLAGPSAKSKLRLGDAITAIVVERGAEGERRIDVRDAAAFAATVNEAEVGDVVWAVVEGRQDPVAIPVGLNPASPRAQVIAPFQFVADIFLALLKMLIVPIVFTSIVSGVSSIGTGGELRRIGVKTFAYYTASSLVAIVIGQILVNLLQ